MDEGTTGSVGEGIGKAVMDGLEWLGEKTVEMAGKSVAMAGAAVGGLLAMVPGLGEMGAAVAALASKGGEPDRGSIAPSVTPVKAKTPEIEAPAVSQKIEINGLPKADMEFVSQLRNGGGASLAMVSADPIDIGQFKPPANLPSLGHQAGQSFSRA